ncbi:MAG: TolC family protein [Bacteroidales bacterium]|nr:TolC family protein [Bacteroidales bacterium]
MKTRYRILIVLSVLLALGSDLYAQYTISICQQKVEANYPLVKKYDLVEQSRSFNLKNANMAYLPQVTLQAKASYQSEVTEIPISLPGVNIEPFNKDQYNAVMQVDQVIWDGGATASRKNMIKKESDLEKSRLDVDMYAVRERVNQVYFGVVLIDKQIEQTELLLKDLERNVNKINAYISGGLANQSDLDVINVEVLNAKQKETELKAGRRAYVSMLSAMMGINPDYSSTFEIPQDTATSFEIRRPELIMLQIQGDFLDTQRGIVKSQLKPKVGAYIQAGYGRPGLNMLNNTFSPFYIAGVKAVWNLGGFYTKKRDLGLIDLNKKSVENSRETFLYNTNLQVVMQSEEIKKIKELLNRDDEVIALREKIQKSAEIKLGEGTMSVSDMVHEMNQLDAARVIKAKHEVELMMAIYNFKNTTNN